MAQRQDLDWLVSDSVARLPTPHLVCRWRFCSGPTQSGHGDLLINSAEPSRGVEDTAH